MSLEMWSQLKKYNDGDNLDAATLNVPVGQLGDRTSYLYARLKELMGNGPMSAVVLTDVDLSTDEGYAPDVGNAVYLYNKKGVFAKAKARMSLYDDFTASDSAFTIGILQVKNGNKGDVLVYGSMNLNPDGSPIRVSDIIESGEEFRPGRYYLSANEAGRLTSHPNGPLIYVCTIDGSVDGTGGISGTAIVTPQFLDIGTSHVHRTAVLTARPAGELSDDGKHVLGYGTSTPGPFYLLFGGTWTGTLRGLGYKFGVVADGESPIGLKLTYSEADSITINYIPLREFGEEVPISNGLTARLMLKDGVDPSDISFGEGQDTWDTLVFPEAGRGWIDHIPSALDETPAPLYDYVIGMDPQVANYWPPVPPMSAAIIVNGVEMDNKALFPDNPTVSFGRTTIHWWENDDGYKPWPEAFVSRGADIDPELDKNMVMHWVRGFQCATGPVTSLQARKGSPVKVYGFGTDSTANVGDLEIDADLDFVVEDGGLPGYKVPKAGRGGKLLAGPVVEKIIGGAGVNVISKAGCPDGQGTVVISVDDGSYRSQFQDIALENAEQAKIGMFPYIRLKGYTNNSILSPSAFTATMRVPTNLPRGRYRLKILASVFGEEGFEDNNRQHTAGVRMSYNILPDYSGDDMHSNLKTSLLRPGSDRIVNIPFGHASGSGTQIVYNGFDPILATTDEPGAGAGGLDEAPGVFGTDVPDPVDFPEMTAPYLEPGYLVGIRISRSIPTGGSIEPYTKPIGFINLSWALVYVGD